MTRPTQAQVFSALVLLLSALMAVVVACVVWALYNEKPLLFYISPPAQHVHLVASPGPAGHDAPAPRPIVVMPGCAVSAGATTAPPVVVAHPVPWQAPPFEVLPVIPAKEK